MVMLVTMLTALLTLAVLYCGWRAISLFTAWRPAAAAELSSDYGERAQQRDRWRWGWISALNTAIGDEDDARSVTSRVVFEDAAGVRHRVRVERSVVRGRTPDSTFTLWYDPADPRRVTMYGPGRWLLAAMTVAAIGAGMVETARGLP